MAGFSSVLLVLLLALAGCVSVLSQAPAAQTSPARRPPRLCGPLCRIYCPFGNVLDWRGCPICKCRDRPICPLVRCSRPCRWGYRIVRGCQTCLCNCPIPRCPRPCPGGYVYKYGCRTCQCRCPRIKCWRPCRWGYIYRNGCRTCQCRRGPSCPPWCRYRYCWNLRARASRRRFGGCRNCPPGCGGFEPILPIPFGISSSDN